MMRSACGIVMTFAIIAFAAGPTVANSGTSAVGCWSIVPSPNEPTGGTGLYRVSALSANDVWASGDFGTSQTTLQPLSEHWDGQQWSIIPAPSVGTAGTRIQGISAASANDVWMVGVYDLTVTNPNATKTLAEHWNGTQWSVISSPNPTLGIRGSYLRGVKALASNDVWTVGYIVLPGLMQTLIEHWDGTQWTIVSSPNGSHADGLLGFE